MNGCLAIKLSDNQVFHLFNGSEFSRWIDRVSAAVGIQFAARIDDVDPSKVEPERSLLVRTRDADDFFTQLNRIVLDNEVEVETVAPSDESVHAVYDYLIGDGTGGGTT